MLCLVNPEAVAEREEGGGIVAKPMRYTTDLIAEYMKSGHWTTETFSDIWEHNAREYPDREAVVDSKTRLTWAQAKQWIDRFALHLVRLGTKKG